jgi:hypothetical protein
MSILSGCFSPFEASQLLSYGIYFSMDILCDICFIALFYVCYLIFLRRLKRGGP